MNIQIQGIKAQGMDMTFDDVEVIDIDGQEVARGYRSLPVWRSANNVCLYEGWLCSGIYPLSFTDEEARLLADMMSSLSFN